MNEWSKSNLFVRERSSNILPAEASDAAIRNPIQNGATSIIHEIISFVISHISLQVVKIYLHGPATLGDFSSLIKAEPNTAPITITLIIFGAEKACQ